MLGFPAVTLRTSIERPEALDTGSITMTDLDPQAVVAGVAFAMGRAGPPQIPDDYTVTNTSERVVNLIMATAQQHRFWSGLRQFAGRALRGRPSPRNGGCLRGVPEHVRRLRAAASCGRLPRSMVSGCRSPVSVGC